jgi:hypothetical protein
MIITGTVCVVAGIFTQVVVSQVKRTDSEGLVADVLVDFIRDPRACSAEFMDGSQLVRCLPRSTPSTVHLSNGRKLRNATIAAWANLGMPSLNSLEQGAPKTPTMAAEEKRLAAVYLTTRLRGRLADTTTRNQTGLNKKAQEQAREIVRFLSPTPSVTEIAQANRMVDTLWRRSGANDINAQTRLLPLIATGMLACLFAGFSLLSTLIARRGILLRGFQLDFATLDGRPASRFRLLARTILGWSILLVPLAGLLIVRFTATEMHATLLTAVAAVALIAWLYGIYTVFKSPSRGLLERITGTNVVIE